jgi:hypothetical protein
MASKGWALWAATMLVSAPALASGVVFGDFKATFDGIATLGLLLSALIFVLGYRLMVKGAPAKSRAALSNIKIGMKTFKLDISNAAPGVVFAALGCIGMIASLWHLAK